MNNKNVIISIPSALNDLVSVVFVNLPNPSSCRDIFGFMHKLHDPIIAALITPSSIILFALIRACVPPIHVASVV